MNSYSRCTHCGDPISYGKVRMKAYIGDEKRYAFHKECRGLWIQELMGQAAIAYWVFQASPDDPNRDKDE